MPRASVTVHPAHLRVVCALLELLGAPAQVAASRLVPLGDVWITPAPEGDAMAIRQPKPHRKPYRKLWPAKDKQAYWAELAQARKQLEAARRARWGK